jgi:protein-S-isoprenylcysteine O-methyltransferase Ste14
MMKKLVPFKVISIVGFLIMVVALLLLLNMHCLFGDNIVSIAVQILAVGLMIWARVTFGRRSFHAAGNPTVGGLITSGPYHYIRHPIYASILYFSGAGILSHLSILSLTLGLSILAAAGIRIFVEEKLLRENYPAYSEYAEHTKRIIPFLV